MNWNRIAKLALVLFAAQVVVGFLDGLLVPPAVGLPWLFTGHAASFIACSLVFALFAMRIPTRPFSNAFFGLLLYILMGFVFHLALSSWLIEISWSSVAIELSVVILALVVGTSVGVGMRQRVGYSADA